MQSTTGQLEVLLFADDLHGDASRSHESTSDGSTCKVSKEEKYLGKMIGSDGCMHREGKQRLEWGDQKWK